jgi:pyruvate dehydrogenase E2 component (dihydrolipoyllysine-residue acetyltransferase)
MAEFLMPTLGSDMTEGTLVEWKKKVGERVVKGEIIAEVDTEKAAIEIESFHTGVIEQLLAKPGERIPVGTVMATIREDGTQAKPVGLTEGTGFFASPCTCSDRGIGCRIGTASHLARGAQARR